MDIQKMAVGLNWACVFFPFIRGPRKDLGLKREPQKKISDRFPPVVGARYYGIRSGAHIRDAAFPRERITAQREKAAQVLGMKGKRGSGAGVAI